MDSFRPLAIISVFGVMFGFFIGAQPGGVGIDTVRSVRLLGATGSPVTPTLSRYFHSGTGTSVVVETALVVGLVDKIDWKSGDFGPQATADIASVATATATAKGLTESCGQRRPAKPAGCPQG